LATLSSATIERVRYVRKALGDKIDIMVDINTRYSLLDLKHALPALEECRVFWIEEPFTPDNLADYAQMNKRTSFHSRAAKIISRDFKPGSCSKPRRWLIIQARSLQKRAASPNVKRSPTSHPPFAGRSRHIPE
jgi:hypothetical protein